MNERFWELAKRADVLIDYGDDITVGRYSIGGSTEKMEKFAELIIRECADYVQFYYKDHMCEGIAHDMKTHFGVEE